MVSMEERRALRDDGWGVAQQLPSGERRWHDFDSRPPSWRRQQEPQEPPRQRRRVVVEGGWPLVDFLDARVFGGCPLGR